MKKWVSLMLALVMLFALCACGSAGSDNVKDEAAETEASAEPDLLAELETRDCTSVSADGVLIWSPSEMVDHYNETLAELDSGLSARLQNVGISTTLGGGLYAGDDVIGVLTFTQGGVADSNAETPNIVEYFDVAVLEGDADQMRNAMAAMMMTLDDSLTYDDAAALLEQLPDNEKIELHGVTYDASLCIDPGTLDTLRFHF